jgi:hypothetical protein
MGNARQCGFIHAGMATVECADAAGEGEIEKRDAGG